MGDTRRIVTTSRWLLNLGEKISALHLDDLDGDGRLEIYAGTEAGNLHVVDLADGTETGSARTDDGPINAFVRYGDGLMVAGRGIWRVGPASVTRDR